MYAELARTASFFTFTKRIPLACSRCGAQPGPICLDSSQLGSFDPQHQIAYVKAFRWRCLSGQEKRLYAAAGHCLCGFREE